MIKFVSLKKGTKCSADQYMYREKKKLLEVNSETMVPGSYDKALKCIQSELSPSKRLHCCINDCIIYRDEYADVWMTYIHDTS